MKNKKKQWILFGIIGLIAIYIFSQPSVDPDAAINVIKRHHCKTDWVKINQTEKTKILEEFIKYDSKLTDKFGVNYIASQYLQGAVKYPETIIIEGEPINALYVPLNSKIIDRDKGIIEFYNSFTSENKLSMKVKGFFKLKVQYTAGCKPFKILDFKID